MKRKIFTLTLVLGIFGSINLAKAQSNAFKINIFSPIVRTVSVFFEHATSESSSAQLGFFYTGFKVTDTKFSGFGITPEYRFYLSETSAPQGFYVGPFLRYQNFSLTEEITDSKGTLSTVGGGLLIGKHWIFKEKISLDLFIGPSYSSGSVKAKDGANEDIFSVGSFSGFSARAGLTLGLAF